MKPVRLIVLGSLIGGALLTLAVPSQAAFRPRSARHSAIHADREALHADRHERRADKHQLFRDRRDGAAPAVRATIEPLFDRIARISPRIATTCASTRGCDEMI